jgi:hypothetical protein
MKTFKISEELINAILGYLGTQPYQTVAPLIQKIMSEVKLIEEKPEEVKEEKK